MMKTANVYNLTQRHHALEFGVRTFVIGVKGTDNYSLEALVKRFPEIKIERLPETVNVRYINNSPDNHILQPAWVTLEK